VTTLFDAASHEPLTAESWDEGRAAAAIAAIVDDAERAFDPQTLWLSYGYGGSEGYAYVFPKRHHVNVGIGYVLDYFRTRAMPPPAADAPRAHA
jgi:flavin-dependent dehydrogenase